MSILIFEIVFVCWVFGEVGVLCLMDMVFFGGGILIFFLVGDLVCMFEVVIIVFGFVEGVEVIVEVNFDIVMFVVVCMFVDVGVMWMFVGM